MRCLPSWTSDIVAIFGPLALSCDWHIPWRFTQFYGEFIKMPSILWRIPIFHPIFQKNPWMSTQLKKTFPSIWCLDMASNWGKMILSLIKQAGRTGCWKELRSVNWTGWKLFKVALPVEKKKNTSNLGTTSFFGGVKQLHVINFRRVYLGLYFFCPLHKTQVDLTLSSQQVLRREFFSCQLLVRTLN